MSRRIRVVIPRQTIQAVRRWSHSSSALLCVLLLVPVAAHAQSGSPFDTGFTNLQTLFTGTVAKVASLIAIVIGGYPPRNPKKGWGLETRPLPSHRKPAFYVFGD